MAYQNDIIKGHYKNPKAKSKAQQALLASAEVTARNSTTRQRLDRNSIREFQGENRKACPTFPKSILYFWKIFCGLMKQKF